MFFYLFYLKIFYLTTILTIYKYIYIFLIYFFKTTINFFFKIYFFKSQTKNLLQHQTH